MFGFKSGRSEILGVKCPATTPSDETWAFNKSCNCRRVCSKNVQTKHAHSQGIFVDDAGFRPKHCEIPFFRLRQTRSPSDEELAEHTQQDAPINLNGCIHGAFGKIYRDMLFPTSQVNTVFCIGPQLDDPRARMPRHQEFEQRVGRPSFQGRLSNTLTLMVLFFQHHA